MVWRLGHLAEATMENLTVCLNIKLVTFTNKNHRSVVQTHVYFVIKYVMPLEQDLK